MCKYSASTPELPLHESVRTRLKMEPAVRVGLKTPIFSDSLAHLHRLHKRTLSLLRHDQNVRSWCPLHEERLLASPLRLRSSSSWQIGRSASISTPPAISKCSITAANASPIPVSTVSQANSSVPRWFGKPLAADVGSINRIPPAMSGIGAKWRDFASRRWFPRVVVRPNPHGG